jgi:hypothetical protein
VLDPSTGAVAHGVAPPFVDTASPIYAPANLIDFRIVAGAVTGFFARVPYREPSTVTLPGQSIEAYRGIAPVASAFTGTASDVAVIFHGATGDSYRWARLIDTAASFYVSPRVYQTTPSNFTSNILRHYAMATAGDGTAVFLTALGSASTSTTDGANLPSAAPVPPLYDSLIVQRLAVPSLEPVWTRVIGGRFAGTDGAGAAVYMGGTLVAARDTADGNVEVYEIDGETGAPVSQRIVDLNISNSARAAYLLGSGRTLALVGNFNSSADGTGASAVHILSLDDDAGTVSCE